YTFDDVVAGLNDIVEYDWKDYLQRFADERNPPFLEGVDGSGRKLVYTDTPTEYEKQYKNQPQSTRHIFNFTCSIGLTMAEDGLINDVRWNGPAFKAGVSTGATLVAVDGRDYSVDALKSAITAAKNSKSPIKLTLKYQGSYRTVPVDYHDGLQYPHLVRVKGTPDYLSEIIAPRK